MSRPDWRLLIYLRNQENSKKSLSWLWHIIKKKKHIKYKNHTRNYKMRILIGFLLLCLQGKKNFKKRKKQDWGAFQSNRLQNICKYGFDSSGKASSILTLKQTNNDSENSKKPKANSKSFKWKYYARNGKARKRTFVSRKRTLDFSDRSKKMKLLWWLSK